MFNVQREKHSWYYLNLFPLIPACTGRPGLPLLPACTARPGLPLSAPVNGLDDDSHRRSPSHYQASTHKTMMLIWGRLRKWSQIISAQSGYFKSRISGRNLSFLIEFGTTFLRVLTCFNGCAAAMDARLGFGTRLRWFCDRGVWWKRTFCGKFGSGNDVDWLLLDSVFRCQQTEQWFEWCSHRFCCDVPDSNDSLTSRRRLIYVNLCFHLYLPSH